MIWPPGERVSGLSEGRMPLEIFGLRLSFARVWLVSQQALHALVEVLRCDRLSFAGREFACHLGLRIVTQGTGLRGGISSYGPSMGKAPIWNSAVALLVRWWTHQTRHDRSLGAQKRFSAAAKRGLV